jgi:glucose-6-phosphate isomerase
LVAVTLPYTHRYDTCFAPAVGGGLTPSEFNAAIKRTEPALDKLRAWHADGSLPLLRLPGARDDLAALRPVAERFRASFDDVVVLGTGGSSLGGQALYALADLGFGPPEGSPRLKFLDNVDPATFEALFARVDLARTGFIAISKSGSTAETLTQLIVCLDELRRRGLSLADHVAVITEPKDNLMRRMARQHGFTTLDHDPGIGGRFSALSLVGLLPATICGLDPAAVRAGAAAVLEPVLAKADAGTVAPAVGAALAVALTQHRGTAMSVLMPYVDRLDKLGQWYCQLWAESLGKDGKGLTPIRALGTVDQHSQLQLYLGGPRDKMFTLITSECAGQGRAVPPDLAADKDLAYLAGRRMGDLLDAEQRATAVTLARNGRPTRVLHLETIDERAVGALMMHFMLETIVAAHLLEVDAFDQPAVEEGKVLAREYLGVMGRKAAQ